MTPDINFKSLSYNPFSIHKSSINSEHDPDINFYQDISSLETHYCNPNDFKNNFQSFLKDSFSVLHFNIRSMNKNFESFKEFDAKTKFKFSIVCFSETWVDDISFSKNLSFKIREDLSINYDANQSLSIEISSTKSKNIFSIRSTAHLTVI